MQLGAIITRMRAMLDTLSFAERRVVLDALRASHFVALSNTERTQRHRFIKGNASVAQCETPALHVSPTPPDIASVRVVSSSSNENRQVKKQAEQVLRFLNEKTGRSYRNVKTNLDFIENRLKSGASLADCRGVIARKVREWKGTDLEKYLRPATLFNATKFEQYVGEQEPEQADDE